jgi:tRNA A37 methylthiotransferase MiaB
VDHVAESVALISVGCRTNQEEVSALAAELRAKGFSVVDNSVDADIIVVNTCSVTSLTESKTGRLVRSLSREAPGARILVTGCFAQQHGEAVLEYPGVAWVVGNGDKHRIPSIIADSPGGGAYLPDIDNDSVFSRGGSIPGPNESGRTRFSLKIQEGCDFRCAYCVVPSLRGPSRSAPVGQLVDTFKRAVDMGYREIVLTGTHIGQYRGVDLSGNIDDCSNINLSNGINQSYNLNHPNGADQSSGINKRGCIGQSGNIDNRSNLNPSDGINQPCNLNHSNDADQSGGINKYSGMDQSGNISAVININHPGDKNHPVNLESLLNQFLKVPGDYRIRLSSLDPRDLTDPLIALAGGGDRVGAHLHVGVESLSAGVLSLMGRPYRGLDLLMDRLRGFRERYPRAGLGADFIVGHPGETDAMFEETLRAVESIGFTYGHVFRYSKRRGTAAAAMPGQAAEPVKKSRSGALRGLLKKNRKKFLSLLFASPLCIIVESENPARGVSGNYIRVEVPGIRARRGAWARVALTGGARGDVCLAEEFTGVVSGPGGCSGRGF